MKKSTVHSLQVTVLFLLFAFSFSLQAQVVKKKYTVLSDSIKIPDHHLIIGNGTLRLDTLSTGDSGQVLLSNGHTANPRWGTLSSGSGSGGCSAITPITAVLDKAVNTTDTVVILRVPVPANSWKDGQTIEVKEWYVFSHSDLDDTTNFGQFHIIYKIGDSIITQSGIGPGYQYPDTGVDGYGFEIKRIGSDIFFVNKNTSATTDRRPLGMTSMFESHSILQLAQGELFGKGYDKEPSAGRLRNIDFTRDQNVTIAVSFEAAYPHNYIESKKAVVWKYPDSSGCSGGGSGNRRESCCKMFITGAYQGVSGVFWNPNLAVGHDYSQLTTSFNPTDTNSHKMSFAYLIGKNGEGTLRNFTFKADFAPTGTEADTITLWKNGVATSLQVVLTADQEINADSTDTLSVVEGDLLAAKIMLSSGTASENYASTIEYDMDSCCSGGGGSSASAGKSAWPVTCSGGAFQRYVPLGSGAADANLNYPTFAGGYNTKGASLAPFSGTIRNLYVNSTGTSNGTDAFTVYINGVASALTVTIANTASSGNDVTHTATFSAGDGLSIGYNAGGNLNDWSISVEVDPN